MESKLGFIFSLRIHSPQIEGIIFVGHVIDTAGAEYRPFVIPRMLRQFGITFLCQITDPDIIVGGAPVPLPEYASRNQTLARGEEEASGRIVFPVFDSERGVYDIYAADIADGDNLQLLQDNASQPAISNDGTELAYRSWQQDRRGLFASAPFLCDQCRPGGCRPRQRLGL